MCFGVWWSVGRSATKSPIGREKTGSGSAVGGGGGGGLTECPHSGRGKLFKFNNRPSHHKIVSSKDSVTAYIETSKALGELLGHLMHTFYPVPEVKKIA